MGVLLEDWRAGHGDGKGLGPPDSGILVHVRLQGLGFGGGKQEGAYGVKAES